MSDSLYFIAIIPPDPIRKDVLNLQNRVAMEFGSCHALKAPPHITLHMPFKWKGKNLEKLRSLIKGINDEIDSFEVQLKDFDVFEPRVVFVNVETCTELGLLQREVVQKCRRELNLDNANYKNRAFLDLSYEERPQIQF